MQRPLAVRDSQLFVAARCISEKGRYDLYNLDCVILCKTYTDYMCLAGKKRLRGYTPNMSQTIAYLRTFTDKQDLNNQKLEILEWARKKDLKIDEFVEITISSRKTRKQRRIEEVLEMLTNSDTLIVTELSRLGRSTAEVITRVNELVARNIRVIILKQNLDISQHDMNSKIVIALFSLFAELERDLISLRTKEALAAKRQQGKTLGKPKGLFRKANLMLIWSGLKISSN